MTIDWSAFTPVSALIGGALIGMAAAWLVLLNGRIAGISGILSGLLTPRSGDIRWRLSFVLGLLLSPWLYSLVVSRPVIEIEASWYMLVLAGLLVGIGTRFGSGCTSGHGVCGLARLSPRSLVATLCFMATGFATVYVVRHLLAG